MDNYILGLDISTANIGVALFKENGELAAATRISPKSRFKTDNSEYELILKAQGFKNFMSENYGHLNVTELIIERPLSRSNNANTVAVLNFFNGMISLISSEMFDVEPQYIDSGEAREFGLPETNGKRISPKTGKEGKKAVRFGCLPTKIGDEKIDKKLVVLHQVAKRYPTIGWRLNNNMSLAVDNCDIADAITCVLGYKQKNGDWQNKVTDRSGLVEFLSHLHAYKKLTQKLKHMKKNRNLSQEEMHSTRKTYILEEFKIQDYLNIDVSKIK